MNLISIALMSVIIFRHIGAISMLFVLLIVFLGLYKNNFQIKIKIPDVLLDYFPYILAGITASLFSNYLITSFLVVVREIFFLFFLMLITNWIAREKNGVAKLMAALKLGVLIVGYSVIGEALGFFIFKIDSSLDSGRFSGILMNPSAPGHFLTVAIPLICAFNKVALNNRNNFYLIFFGLFVLILTGSRSAIAAFLLTLYLQHIFIYSNGKIFSRVFSLILPLLIFGILSLVIIENHVFLFDLLRIANGLSGREELWEIAFRIISVNPFFGAGLGTYRYEFFGFNDPAENIKAADNMTNLYNTEIMGLEEIGSGFGAVIGGSSHNLTLDILSSSGVFGLLAIFYFVIRCFIKYNKIKSNGDISMDILCGNSKIILLVFLIRAQFEPVGLVGGGFSSNLILWLAILLPFIVHLNKSIFQIKKQQ